MSNLSKKIILVVENNTREVSSKYKVFEKHGFEVYHANNRLSALRQFGRLKKINLVIVDTELTGMMNAFETADMILEHQELPLLFNMSYEDEYAVEEIMKINCSGIIDINTNENVLVSSIKIAMELFSMSQKGTKKIMINQGRKNSKKKTWVKTSYIKNLFNDHSDLLSTFKTTFIKSLCLQNINSINTICLN